MKDAIKGVAPNGTVLSQELKVTSASLYLFHSLSVCRGKSMRLRVFCLPVEKKITSVSEYP